MSDSNAILQAIQVLKAQGVLPNLNKAQNELLPSLVSTPGNVDALNALILNATALLALVGAAIGNSTYYVGDYAVANYVV